MADQARKQSLRIDLDTARSRVTGYVTALRHDLNVGARLKSSLAHNRVAWFGAAGVLGLLLSKIPASRRKVVVKGPNGQAEKAGKAAFALTALKFGLSIAKPAIVDLVTKKILKHPAPQPSAEN
jgi:hypothetical protein